MTLAEYLRERNVQTEAWVAEDPANRWAGMYTEDLSHWAEMGITTVAELERYEMETSIWDLFKDVHGFRPRHIDFKTMTDEDLKTEYEYLVDELSRQQDYEEQRQSYEMMTLEDEALEEDKLRSEMPEPIDYVANNYQEGWL